MEKSLQLPVGKKLPESEWIARIAVHYLSTLSALRDLYLMVQVNTNFHIVLVPVKKFWSMEKQLLVGGLLLSSPQLKHQVVFSNACCLLSVILFTFLTLSEEPLG